MITDVSAFNAARGPLSYPPIPTDATEFQRRLSYEPATVRGWEWSTTFGRWGAFVTFADGREYYSFPRP